MLSTRDTNRLKVKGCGTIYHAGGEDGGRAGGPEAHLIPQIQLDNSQIILHTPEINLKTSRTNFTTNGREEATSMKMRCAETWFGRETDQPLQLEGSCGGREG